MKKLLALALMLLLLITCASAENLLVNADFSAIDRYQMPEGWENSSWDPSHTQYEAEDGTVMIRNFMSNDARWTQDVKVKPRTSYRLSAYVKAEDCGFMGRGANLSVLNSNAYSESVFDTEGEWEYLELYGMTGSDQREVTVCLRLGGYSGDCTGTVWFKDVSFEESEVPLEYTALSFATFAPQEYYPARDEADGELPDRNTETWLLVSFISLLVFLAALTSVRRLPQTPDAFTEKKGIRILGVCAVMLAAFVIRLFVAWRFHGYEIDINCFSCWSERVANNGFGLYADGYFCDYPPVYMMLLGVIGIVRQMLGIAYGSNLHVVLIKLFPIAADIAASLLVYGIYRKKAGHVRALLLSCAIALSPAFITDSAAWGQADGLLAVGLAVSVYFAMGSKWHIALPVYALMLMTKPQAMLFGPIGLAACVIDVIKNRKLILKAVAGAAVSLALIYAISLPFAYGADPSISFSGTGEKLLYPITWVLEKLLGATSGYKYITVNACNLYVLLGKNWGQVSGFWGNFSWIMFGFAYAYAIFLYVWKRDTKNIALVGAVLMVLLFNFAPMMHERYMMPALLLLVIAYAESGDRRLMWYAAAATATQFVNMVLLLEWGWIRSSDTSLGHLQAAEQSVNFIISLINVAGALFLVYTAFDMVVLGHIREIKPAGKPISRLAARANAVSDWRLNLRKFDYIAMAAVTAVYGVFTFFNLGTTDYPESFLKTTDYDEEIVFDLGEVRSYRLTYNGGIADCAFTVALSDDGEHWSEENYAEYSAGNMHRWLWYVPKTQSNGTFTNAVQDHALAADREHGASKVTYASANVKNPVQTSRFVKFKVKGIGLVLNEVGFIDPITRTLFEVKSVTGSVPGNAYEHLINEQDTVALIPSYLNGMYFDEIYHARTAYELANGYSSQEILEWSHPHLGKLLIAVGIELFGMNPFGWRFMGALFGVMMLPLMYLLAKQLTGKSNLSLVAMLLMTFDSMHFTQSRIATVDVFAVFFIMLMYLFMIRYYKMNLHREKLSKTFIPLGLSALSMGLGICAKWICIYAAAGLAVIFFISIFKRFNEYLYLRKADPDGEIAKAFPRKLILTAVFCVVMFIIVPAVLYYLSYYWHFRTSGGLSVKKVWELQEQMFRYHSGLSYDTHFFRSPWYEWPLIVKPMWYYSADTSYVGYGFVSSISCMGNPAVWWTGLVSLVAMLFMLVTRKKPSKAMLLVAIGFASQFLPWVLVPRSTFIYHYFASVPFIILATVLMLLELSKLDRNLAKCAAFVLVGAAAVLFAMFYPLESGLICRYDYAMNLRWFNWYNFALQ